jgi:CheY-like chemotaxis protein
LLEILRSVVQQNLDPSPTDLPDAPFALGTGAPLRILLAEDVPANQELVLALLDPLGHTVRIAQNGREAVEACRSEVFDLILMDVQMPVMGGVQAASAIRELANGKRAPIIALTAHAMKGDRERYLASGMEGYVSKPVRATQLFGEINRVMHSASPPAPLLSAREPLSVKLQ